MHVVIARAVKPEGLPLAYEVMDGNSSDIFDSLNLGIRGPPTSYQGPATVTATWTGIHQAFTVVDSGYIYKN